MSWAPSSQLDSPSEAISAVMVTAAARAMTWMVGKTRSNSWAVKSEAKTRRGATPRATYNDDPSETSIEKSIWLR